MIHPQKNPNNFIMKHLIACLALFFIIQHNCFAQYLGTSAPTTEEEYNYLTKGYQTQISEGLDMKKGTILKTLVA